MDAADGTRKAAAESAAARGFRAAAPAERAAFAILSSLAATIAASRLINYVRERSRHAPTFRSLGRRAYHWPGRGTRVHHYLAGIAVSSGAGAAAILTRRDGRELWFSLPFGVGAGLTLDEIAFLVELDNPYWQSERLALIEAAIAAGGAAAFGARFVARGRTAARDPRAARSMRPAAASYRPRARRRARLPPHAS